MLLQGLNTAEIGLGGWSTWIDEDTSEHNDNIMGSDGESDKEKRITGMYIIIQIMNVSECNGKNIFMR